MTTTQRGSAGTLLGGRYRLVEPLPGAGRTWRARDEIDGRDLAARVVQLPDGLPDADRRQARQRALRDAAAVGRSHHPGVAHVVDAVVENGVPWVVSVLPPGHTLGELVRHGGPVRPDAAALIGLQMLDALDAAGVPHGDLTPDDVIVGADGRVVMTGFGTTPVDGTAADGFRPPEGGAGRAADLWALGVTLYVAVEGRMPDGTPARAGALGPALDGLLDRDPDRRPDPDAVRRMLADAAGEPDAPVTETPDLQDPEVAAALAAFDAALAAGPPARSDARQVPAPRADAETQVPAPRADAETQVPAPRADAETQVPAPRAAPVAARATAAAPTALTNGRAQAPAQIPWNAPPTRGNRPGSPVPAARTEAALTPRPAQDPPTPTPEPTPSTETPTRTETLRTETPPRTETPRTETPQLAEPAASTDGRHGHRRLLGVAIAIAAALAAVAALLIPFLLNRGNDGQAAPAARPTAASPLPTTTPEPTETTPSPDTPIPPPAGYQLYRDPAGWSIAVPEGWTAARRGTSVTFTKADRTLRVNERTNPPKDPYDAALKLQPVIEAATPGYDFIRIAGVAYRGWPTADYEYRGGATPKTHSLIRSTVPNPRQVFDISWTCLDDAWTADKTFFDAAVSTFDPGA